MIIDHGTFSLYTPATPIIPPRPVEPGDRDDADAMEQHAASLAVWEAGTAAERRLVAMIEAGALFLRNQALVDWYSIAHAPPSGRSFAMVKDGRVAAVTTDPSTLFPINMQLIETDQPVEVGYSYVNEVLAPYVVPLADLKAQKIAAAWAECQRRIDAGSVSVPTSAGIHTYGIDKASQDNIKSVLIGVALGVTPNPRQWTPKGATSPISLTHADLTLVGDTMMGAVDAIIQAYLVHKAGISAAATRQEVEAYSIETGWPN